MNRWSLNNINQKLETNKLNIINERQQIIRAEHLLSHFEKSFAEQNKIINYTRDNSHTLVKEIYNDGNKHFKTSSDSVASIYHQSSNPPPDPKESLMDRISSIPQSINKTLTMENQLNKSSDSVASIYHQSSNLPPNPKKSVMDRIPHFIKKKLAMENQSNKSTSAKDRKRKNSDNIEEDQNIIQSDTSMSKSSCKKFKIPNREGVTLNHILLTNGYVISGSNGYLVRSSKKGNCVYNTCTTDNIFQSELVVARHKLYITAFTRLRILIFFALDANLRETMEFPTEYIDNIFHVGMIKNKIFITLKNGDIKTILETEWRFIHHFSPMDRNIRTVFSASMLSNYGLALYKDSMLYKMTLFKQKGCKVIIEKSDKVAGIKDVKGVVRCQKDMLLCYSDNVFLLIDENGNTVFSLTLEYGIKFVAVDLEDAVVVDGNNTIHVYSTAKKGVLGKKKLEKAMKGNITSVGTISKKVFVIMDNSVFCVEMK